jgi:membrane peptidoglycan carboxypeptidase
MAFGDQAAERRRRAAVRARMRARRVLADEPPKSSLLAKLFLGLIALSVLGGAGVAAGLIYFYLRTAQEIGSPGSVIAELADYGGAQIYDRNDTLLYRFPDPQGGIQAPMPLDQISPAMRDATVSTEDSTFWSNPGIDVQGIGGALLHNVQTSGDPFSGAGGSAITQQLVKNTLIPEEERTAKTAVRKGTELVYALKLTREYPKEQILDWYLNTVNYGGVYDGVESAAEGYFGVHAKDLDLAQSAMLAGIPQSPADYSPYANPQGAQARQAQVLDLMVKHNSITSVTQPQADAAKKEALTFHPTQESLPLRAPWFVEYVKQRLIERFGQHCFDTCGLVVKTTLDLDLEDQAQQILNTNLQKYGASPNGVGVHNGALLSVDARTGEILVMLGSRDYSDESLPIQGNNNFTTAVLQPGSSFKPFVYMTLFMKRGYGPDSIIWDVPYTANTGYRCEDPVSGGRTQGPIPVRLGLGSSLNCAANRAADTAGVQNVIETAQKMGITTLGDPGQYGASIATGGANITMLDMAYAYTTLARNGNMIGDSVIGTPKPGLRTLDPVAFTDVRDGRGQVRYHYEPKTSQVVPAQYPYLVTSIISDCQNRRLIWACGFPEFVLSDGRPVAAKTGTQAGEKTAQTLANWQFMYTPQIVTGGWVGNADRTTWSDVNGSANAVGYSVEQLEDEIVKADSIPKTDFDRPTGIVSVPVHVPDGSRGLLGGCGPIEQGLFANGDQPDQNNRICKNGAIVVPQEQANTGGLEADGRVCNLVTPTPDPRTGQIPPSGTSCTSAIYGGATATPGPGSSPAPVCVLQGQPRTVVPCPPSILPGQALTPAPDDGSGVSTPTTGFPFAGPPQATPRGIIVPVNPQPAGGPAPPIVQPQQPQLPAVPPRPLIPQQPRGQPSGAP